MKQLRGRRNDEDCLPKNRSKQLLSRSAPGGENSSNECCIVDLQVMRDEMKCMLCQKDLLMSNFVRHYGRGLATVCIIIKGEDCNSDIEVETSKNHSVNIEARAYMHDKNHNYMTPKPVLVAYHAGVGRTGLNNISAYSDLPISHSLLFRNHEEEVGSAIEKQTKLSCNRTAQEKRRLIIEKMQELEEQLVPEMSAMSDDVNLTENSTTKEFDDSLGLLLNIIVSDDMGWSRRATRRSDNNNSSKLCVEASSQSNKSWHNSVADEFAKNESNSTSTSGDTRVATAVLTFNDGESLMNKVKEEGYLHELSLLQKCSKVVYGICDSLRLFRNKYPARQKGGVCTLSKSAED
ncbi:hypothetical protein QAD02_008300 [Eretmocerus hayati]|uniref:Uncharacterized protein n=1 Tax=Eretmocerus hayati TaxID=131215 RepID=A0ACC2N647_9HYME|nr:hypothetical protein QAD02_008300 [Eretmocerus hayati]